MVSILSEKWKYNVKNLLIAAYFFTKDGNFNLNEALGFINQFPDVKFFKNLEIDIYDDTEVTKNYIRAQQEINKKDILKFN